MSSKPQNDYNQEIDLSQISKAFGNFFDNISAFIFKIILFIKKKLRILIALFILGAVGGYFMDINSKAYEHEMIVSPNFGSVDYLYSKVNLLESKIKEGDTMFLKSIGIKAPKRLVSIEVDPVLDIYSFVNNNTAMASNAQNTQNFELVKLLSEDGDIKQVIKDNLTSKNYSHHVIHIVTNDLISNKSIVDPIIAYLNESEYFKKIQKTYIDNIKIKMKFNEGMIKQINDLLNQFSTTTSTNQKSDKLVYYNENTQLNQMIATKNGFIEEMGSQRMILINSDKIIKKNTGVINVKKSTGTNNKMKILLPILLIFCFLAFSVFTTFYRKQQAKLVS